MSNVKLTIGAPVGQVVIKNSYCLKVDNMSGDADHFETITTYFDDGHPPEEWLSHLHLKSILPFLQAAKNKEETNYWDGRDLNEWVELLAFQPTDVETFKTWLDFSLREVLGMDVVDHEGGLASIEDFKLTYFDLEGVEHEVTMEFESDRLLGPGEHYKLHSSGE